MSFSNSLRDIHSAISSQSAEIAEKIARLKQAKRNIAEEQRDSLNELLKIIKPALDDSWKGSRANSFDESRDGAHTEIVGITRDDYDFYIERIQAVINALLMQQSALDIASGIAYQASQLLDKGEEAFEELGSKINDLQRRLF